MQDEQNKEKDGGSTDAGHDTSDNSSRTSATEAVTSKVEKDKQYGGDGRYISKQPHQIIADHHLVIERYGAEHAQGHQHPDPGQ